MPLIERSLDDIAKLERAIEMKYGPDVLKHPRENWDENKEKKFIHDIKNYLATMEEKENNYNVEVKDNIEYVSKKTLSSQTRICCECSKYSISKVDDLYLKKLNICYKCYLKLNKQ